MKEFNASLGYEFGVDIEDARSWSGRSLSGSHRGDLLSTLKYFVTVKNEFEAFKKEYGLDKEATPIITLKGKFANQDLNYSFDNLDDCQQMLRNIAEIQKGNTALAITHGVKNAYKARPRTPVIRDDKNPAFVRTKLLKLTQTYLNKENIDPAKREIFSNLNAILHSKEPPLEVLNKFSDALMKADKKLINNHRTPTWLRYLTTAISILTVIPAIARAYNSNTRYGSVRFWAAESAQALEGMQKELQNAKGLKGKF